MQSHTLVVSLAALALGHGALGCGASPRQGASEPASTGPCVLSGNASGLHLTVEGLPDGLTVDGLPAEVTIDGPRALARVLRPLRFDGEGETLRVHAHLAGPTAGAIALSEGTPFVAMRLGASGELAGTAVLSGALSIGDTDWEGIAVRTTLSCAELGLGAEEIYDDSEAPRQGWLTGAQDLPIQSAPNGDVAGVLRMSIEETHGLRAVEVLERRDALAHVRRRYARGTIDGWVPAARVVTPPAPPDTIGLSGHGSGVGCGRSDHPYTYRGTATVRRGARVRAEQTGVTWAVVTEDVTAEVGVRASGETEIIDVPGLVSDECGNLQFDLALVPASDVTLPAP